jgi:hypothetical protein
MSRRVEMEQAERAQRVSALHTLCQIVAKVFLMEMGSSRRLRNKQKEGERQAGTHP